MSGDVQPRKRKDKRKKQRDSVDRRSEGELSFSRQSSVQEDDESSHGVHITKMGTDDVHLHVHQEHGTGGHWCAKIFFFTLLAVLVGLISLIIMEHRGISDLDTPLSESRFSNYFDGWVDEQREVHDEHDAVQASLEEHDDHDEPFEEEEALSEGDDDDEDADHDDDDEEEDEEYHEEEKDNEDEQDEDEDEDEEHDEEDNGEQITKEEEFGGQSQENTDKTAENEKDEEADGNGDEGEDEDDDEDDDNDNEGDSNEAKEVDTKTAENDEQNDDDGDDDENDDDDEDDDGGENEDEDANENVKKSIELELNEADNNDEDDDDNDDDDENTVGSKTKENKQDSANTLDNNDNDDDDDGDEGDDDDDDDDGTFELFDKVVDNDAEELLLLQKKAEAQAAQKSVSDGPASEENEENEAAEEKPSWLSSLAVKLGVGVALALVARLVLLRKGPNTNEEAPMEAMMKRRLTIAGPDDKFPEDVDAPRLPTDELSEDEEIIEEEIIEFLEEEVEEDEMEEEIEEEEEEIEIDEDGIEIERSGKYVPETFEQLNAMYREHQEPSSHSISRQKQTSDNPTINTSKDIFKSNTTPIQKPPPVFVAPPPPPPSKAEFNRELRGTTAEDSSQLTKGKSDESPLGQTKKGTARHDVDYQPADENYDSDEMDEEDEIDGDGDGDEEDLSDIGDISDVDDTELMNRLDAKYGKLPQSTSSAAKEFESDEDPDDSTWTQIKPKDPKTLDSGGAQAFNDDDDEDSFEAQLSHAQAELARENFAAAFRLFSKLALKYPDQPQTFYGQCTAYHQYMKRRNIMEYANEALRVCKRFLAFGRDIPDRDQYRFVAEITLEIIEMLGVLHQSEDIFETLLELFPNDIRYMKKYAVMLIKIDKVNHAKNLLSKILKISPNDGVALAHYGLILLQFSKNYTEAVNYLRRGIDTSEEGTNEALLYLKLGEAYQRLEKPFEARKIYERAVDLKLIPSIMQRPVYFVPKLRAQPVWKMNETGYSIFLDPIRINWRTIRDEGIATLKAKYHFEDESENLRDTGTWQMFELWAQGRQNDRNCKLAPLTCSLIAKIPAVRNCLRGQVKFSVMYPKTHVWPHCGPTNARLRAHLGLVVPKHTQIRIGDEKRTWTEGEFLIFDDSFEHEVWQNGESYRLVLIIDMWHPDLSEGQRRSLTPL